MEEKINNLITNLYNNMNMNKQYLLEIKKYVSNFENNNDLIIIFDNIKMIFTKKLNNFKIFYDIIIDIFNLSNKELKQFMNEYLYIRLKEGENLEILNILTYYNKLFINNESFVNCLDIQIYKEILNFSLFYSNHYDLYIVNKSLKLLYKTHYIFHNLINDINQKIYEIINCIFNKFEFDALLLKNIIKWITIYLDKIIFILQDNIINNIFILVINNENYNLTLNALKLLEKIIQFDKFNQDFNNKFIIINHDLIIKFIKSKIYFHFYYELKVILKLLYNNDFYKNNILQYFNDITNNDYDYIIIFLELNIEFMNEDIFYEIIYHLNDFIINLLSYGNSNVFLILKQIVMYFPKYFEKIDLDFTNIFINIIENYSENFYEFLTKVELSQDFELIDLKKSLYMIAKNLLDKKNILTDNNDNEKYFYYIEKTINYYNNDIQYIYDLLLRIFNYFKSTNYSYGDLKLYNFKLLAIIIPILSKNMNLLNIYDYNCLCDFFVNKININYYLINNDDLVLIISILHNKEYEVDINLYKIMFENLTNIILLKDGVDENLYKNIFLFFYNILKDNLLNRIVDILDIFKLILETIINKELLFNSKKEINIIIINLINEIFKLSFNDKLIDFINLLYKFILLEIENILENKRNHRINGALKYILLLTILILYNIWVLINSLHLNNQILFETQYKNFYNFLVNFEASINWILIKFVTLNENNIKYIYKIIDIIRNYTIKEYKFNMKFIFNLKDYIMRSPNINNPDNYMKLLEEIIVNNN